MSTHSILYFCLAISPLALLEKRLVLFIKCVVFFSSFSYGHLLWKKNNNLFFIINDQIKTKKKTEFYE